MTSPSRKKHPITLRVRILRTATLCSLLAWGVFFATRPVQSQTPIGSNYHARPVITSSTPTKAKWTPKADPKITPLVPSQPVASTITPVKYQRPDPFAEEPRREYQIQLEPPGLERISRLDSDAKLQERIRQETKAIDPNEVVIFPEEPILSRETYYGRAGSWPTRTMYVEPNYVCYGRLFFQDLNAERYGWDLGAIHPLVSTAKFLYDFALFPAHFIIDPCGNDCSTGYCLPGDPVPFLLYPPELTVRGSMVEVAVILALVAVFP